MLRKLFSAICLIIMLVSSLPGASVPVYGDSERYVVVIDPGHGGQDEGASGTQHESWYNLQVSLYCAERLRADGRFKVVLTRDDDYFITVAERGLIAAEADADLIVSMHFNSIRGSSYSGIEIYSSVLDEFNPQSLCELIADKLSANSGLPIHDLYRRRDDGGNLYYWNPEYKWDVLGDSSSGIVSDYYGIPTWAAKFGFPGIIVEHGYLSNKSDLRIIDSPDMMKKMGYADAEAIIEYFTSHTHEYEDGYTVDQRVSCFSAGKKSRHCKYCCHRVDVRSIASAPDPEAHFWTVKSLVPADCEHSGHAEYVCRYMESFIEKGVEGFKEHTKSVDFPALGHDWQVKFSQELSHTQDGIVVYECSRCKKRRSDVTPADGHSYEVVSAIQPTCTRAGVELLECTVCSERINRAIPALGHDFVLVSYTPSVCTEGGEKRYECSRCGLTKTERSKVPGHDMRLISHADPDCENGGYDEYVCGVCGYTERTEYAALGHSFSDPITIEPDCFYPGTEFVRCFNCGETRTIRDMPALGHDHVVMESYDAEKDQLVYTFFCPRCGDTYTASTPAPHAEAVPAAAQPEEPEIPVLEKYPLLYALPFAAAAGLIAACLVLVLRRRL